MMKITPKSTVIIHDDFDDFDFDDDDDDDD
jgi:hypothetical protein